MKLNVKRKTTIVVSLVGLAAVVACVKPLLNGIIHGSYVVYLTLFG